MDKVLIEITVPVTNATYDMFVPVRSRMYEVLELIKKAVSDMSDGHFIATEETTLCYKESGNIIDVNMTVYELGIKNGSKLMLI
jgi:hypothetical protein